MVQRDGAEHCAREGNSNTQSIAFKDTFKWRWTASRFQLKVDVLRSANADDWFKQVDPGFTWEPGETPTGLTSSLVKPPSELDAENYFVEGRYDRAGFGHLWVDREDRKFLDGGSEIVFGETRVRKDKLDQVFKTTLVLSF